MTNNNLIPLPSLARTLDERENELPEVIDLLSSGQIERDDPRLDYAYHVAGNVGKTLRSWTYDDIQAAYDRINGDNPPSIGDLTFYAEPAKVGRFIVGMGEVHGGDGSPRITIAGALGQLKAIFGAAPTEGERKILLDVEGAVNRPAPVRRKIFERAKAAAERRMGFYQERANELRGGEFYRKTGGTSGKGNRTSTGTMWEIVE